ncbi:hypothetical protein [Nocardioides antri]|uniref:Uncharacterized protein n=1 Tax=Nocardioides antri TaxID=2607659 RepID=A0A5B1M2D1_9ACTN|nr:hypothetical protein [Nocardioides antri]KAA1426289.1 hypothetical protein F0U47_15435 [Nocardioides antri]
MASGLRRPLVLSVYLISEEPNAVVFIVVAMLVTLLVAGLVVLYVAYPHRGETMPAAPWLGEALGKAAEAAPVLGEHEADLLRQRT